jgi:hypothetical protein
LGGGAEEVVDLDDRLGRIDHAEEDRVDLHGYVVARDPEVEPPWSRRAGCERFRLRLS